MNYLKAYWELMGVGGTAQIVAILFIGFSASLFIVRTKLNLSDLKQRVEKLEQTVAEPKEAE